MDLNFLGATENDVRRKRQVQKSLRTSLLHDPLISLAKYEAPRNRKVRFKDDQQKYSQWQRIKRFCCCFFL